MTTIRSSMKYDMEAAKGSLLKPGKEITSEKENMPGRAYDIFPEKTLPAEEERLMLEPADKLAEGDNDTIRDDYIGNASYKMLKDSKEKMVAAVESAKQDSVFANKPEAENLEVKVSGAEKEDKKEEAKNFFSYKEDMKNIAGRISSGDGDGGRIEEQKKLQKNEADIKNKTAVWFGGKVIAVILAMVLLAGGTFYVLWARKSAEEAAINGNANMPPVKEDISNVSDSQDAVRISNLTILANIAVLYHIEHGADFPVSRDYIKLNETNPVTDFLQDALRRYGQSENIMHDPRHPDFYYAYRSADGNDIEFTARLEDPASSVQCQNQDVCIYKKNLTEEDIDNMSDHIERYKP